MIDQDSDGDEDLLEDLEIWARGDYTDDVQKTMKTKNLKRQKDSQHHQQIQVQEQPHQQTQISPSTSHPSGPSKSKQPLSLHITNLPESADKACIHDFFSDRGCLVTSVRLVFDQTSSRGWNNRTFKGVAFIDLGDKKSYEKALSFHRTWFPVSAVTNAKKEKQIKKLRFNVRPTRTKEELAAIVQQTKERVELLKKESLSKKDAEEAIKNDKIVPPSTSIARSNKRKRDDTPKRHDTISKKPKIPKSTINDTQPLKKKVAEKSDRTKTPQRRFNHKRRKIDTDRKLTKKERAKKAAILKSR